MICGGTRVLLTEAHNLALELSMVLKEDGLGDRSAVELYHTELVLRSNAYYI